MRNGLRLLAAAIAFVALVFWLFGGPNLGLTHTTVIRSEYTVGDKVERTVRRQFSPGVDFLAGVWVVCGAVFALSFMTGDGRSASGPH